MASWINAKSYSSSIGVVPMTNGGTNQTSFGGTGSILQSNGSGSTNWTYQIPKGYNSISASVTYSLSQLLPIIYFSGSTAAQVITIPADSSTNNVYSFDFINASSVSVTLTATSSVTILAGSSVTVAGINGVWVVYNHTSVTNI